MDRVDMEKRETTEWQFPTGVMQPSPMASHAIHGIALVLIFLSLFGSLFMLVYGIATKRYKTIGERFPLYTALLAICWSVSHSFDHSYMWLKDGVPPALPACRTLGALMGGFLLAEICMMNVVSICIYLTVYHSRTMHFGSFDWILWAMSLGCGAVFAIVGSAIGAFGPDVHWCFLDMRTSVGRIYMFILAIPCTLALVVPATCYFLVYRKIMAVENAMKRGSKANKANKQQSLSYKAQSSSEPALDDPMGRFSVANGDAPGRITHSSRNKVIVAKLIDFIAADVLTFSGAVAYTVGVGVFQKEPIWLSFWVAMSINSSGWLNAAVFIRQLIRRRRNYNAQRSAHRSKVNINKSMSAYPLQGTLRGDQLNVASRINTEEVLPPVPVLKRLSLPRHSAEESGSV
ncbi:hypothetical protein SpCBS45565_g04165 [Spizellomyces sp. 'palustris']|nr:hypothetical protein SpCBS45565_g04165 [Spizellomyces sp. 'palustris']